jgi:four helix bundle protein
VSAHIAHQLLRFGTSQAGNYRAACRARSKADFIATMGIVEEELDESLFGSTCWCPQRSRCHQMMSSASAEADELLAMTVQSIRTARGGSR